VRDSSDTGEVSVMPRPLAEYETMALPSLTDLQLQAIALRHGLNLDGPDSLSIIDVPYSVVTRVDGTDLAAAPHDHEAFEGVGRELAKLHTAALTRHGHECSEHPIQLLPRVTSTTYCGPVLYTSKGFAGSRRYANGWTSSSHLALVRHGCRP
jgi:hypothetical protein